MCPPSTEHVAQWRHGQSGCTGRTIVCAAEQRITIGAQVQPLRAGRPARDPQRQPRIVLLGRGEVAEPLLLMHRYAHTPGSVQGRRESRSGIAREFTPVLQECLVAARCKLSPVCETCMPVLECDPLGQRVMPRRWSIYQALTAAARALMTQRSAGGTCQSSTGAAPW